MFHQYIYSCFIPTHIRQTASQRAGRVRQWDRYSVSSIFDEAIASSIAFAMTSAASVPTIFTSAATGVPQEDAYTVSPSARVPTGLMARA